MQEDQVWKVPALVLSRGGAVGGTVGGRILEGDKAKSGVIVQMLGNNPVQHPATDNEGQFRFKGLKPGEYLLNIIDRSAMKKG